MPPIAKANPKPTLGTVMPLNSKKFWTFLVICSKIPVIKIKILLNIPNILSKICTKYGK